MNELQALILGLIQGLTEYLPVSSSGHLTIASHLFGLADGESNLAYTVAVHVATVLSTLVILWKEISWLVKGLLKYDDSNRENIKGESALARINPEQKYVLNILVSMIPVGIVGVFFKDYVEEIFGSGLAIVGAMLLVTALLLALSYFLKPKQKQEISIKDAFIIGLAQAIAVMPGLSRSGSTIATGLILGNDKAKLAQFSFLMVIPPILGEALIDTYKMVKEGVAAVFSDISVSCLVIGFAAAFVSGCIACKWMINIVRKGKLIYFAIYCALVGIALLVF